MAEKLSKSEIKFVLLVSLILIVVTGIPYLYGYFSRGSLYYTGLHVFSPFDGTVYFSYIEQVKQGHFLFDNLFSNEANGVKLFNPFWLIVGLTARVLQLPAPWAYHLFRIILIPLFLLSLYKLSSFFIDGYSPLKKKLCFLFSIFATGLGAILVMIKNFDFAYKAFFAATSSSMDLWLPEGNNFLIIFNSPHFIASITLIILIFYYFLKAGESKKLKYSLLAGFLALILFSFHPFFVATIYLVPFIYLVTLSLKERKINFKAVYDYLIIFAISSPAVFYYLYLLATNLPLRIKALQNDCFTPGGLIFFISYGLPLLMAIFAAIYLINKRNLSPRNIFLIVWFWASIFLMYAPVNFQRRLAEGFQIPLTILAFIGLVVIYKVLTTSLQSFKKIKSGQILLIFTPIFILLFCLSNSLIYYEDFVYLKEKPEIAYTYQDIKAALDWYQQKTSLNDTILSSEISGNIIPGLIGRRVFLGHNIETVNALIKNGQVKWFFKDNQNDEAKIEFLKQSRINYVFYSYSEKLLGDFNPSNKTYLEKIFANGEAEIYKVNQD